MAETQDLQKLVVSLEARTAQFEKQMARANAAANRQARAIESRFQRMNKNVSTSMNRMASGFGGMGGVGGMLKGFLPAMTVAGVVSGIKEITEAADDLVDTADRIDFPVTKLKAFQNVVALNGGSVEMATAALDKFQQQIAVAATKGNDLSKILEKYGVALRDSNGQIRPMEDLLNDVILLMGRAASATDRNRLAAIAFGKANTEIAGAVGKGAASVDELNREVARLGPAFEAQQRQLGAANDTIDKFWRTIKENAAIATAEGITALQKFGGQVEDLGEVTNNFIKDPGVATFFDMLFGKGFSAAHGLDEPIANATDAMIEQQEEIKRNAELIVAYRAEIARIKEEDPTFNTTGIENAIMALEARQAELNAQIRDTLGLYGDLERMRFAADSYVDWLTKRGQGYTAVSGAPPQPAYSPTALPQLTVPATKVKADVTVDIPDDDELDDAGKKIGDSISSRMIENMTGAIGAWETRGMSLAAAYRARGGAGEYGRYQIMPANVAAWSKELYGESISGAYFLAHPEIQDEIARYKIGQYMKDYYPKYGAAGVARAWNTGSPTGRATSGYVEGVLGMLRSGGGLDAANANLGDLNEQLNITTDRFEEIRPLAEDFINTFIDGILEGKDAVEVLGDALKQLGQQLIKIGIHQLVGAIFPAGAPLLAAGGNIYPGNVYKVHRDETIVPRVPGKVIPASRSGGNGGGVALSYAPVINIAGNADDGTVKAIRDRVMQDIRTTLPAMVRKSHSNRTL